MIFPVRLAPRDQRQRPRRVVGGAEPHFAGRIVAGRNEDQALVGRLADADAEAELFGLFVERDVLARRLAEPVVARAVAAPLVVDLGEHDSRAVARPYRLADADIGDGLDVLARRQLTNAQLKPL